MSGKSVDERRARWSTRPRVTNSFVRKRSDSYVSRVKAWTVRTSAIASCSTPTASPCASWAAREMSRIRRPRYWPSRPMGGATTNVRSASRQFMTKMTTSPPTSVRTCPRTEMIVWVMTPWTSVASLVTCDMSSPVFRRVKNESDRDCRCRTISIRRSKMTRSPVHVMTYWRTPSIAARMSRTPTSARTSSSRSAASFSPASRTRSTTCGQTRPRTVERMRRAAARTRLMRYGCTNRRCRRYIASDGRRLSRPPPPMNIMCMPPPPPIIMTSG